MEYGIWNMAENRFASLPVVASNIEGIADALNNRKNGILVDSLSVEQFKGEILKLINDKKYRISFGKKAREYTLEKFSWDSIAKQYTKIYNEVRNDN